MSESEERRGWQAFIDRACTAVGVDPALVDAEMILTLSRDVAHSGARAMAPVSAFILGLAAGAEERPDIDALRSRLEEAILNAPTPREA